jgi:hypothetical protein
LISNLWKLIMKWDGYKWGITINITIRSLVRSICKWNVIN